MERDQRMSDGTLFYNVRTISGDQVNVLVRAGVIEEITPHPEKMLDPSLARAITESRLEIIEGEGDLLSPFCGRPLSPRLHPQPWSTTTECIGYAL